jgi:hypothetical protein
MRSVGKDFGVASIQAVEQLAGASQALTLLYVSDRH